MANYISGPTMPGDWAIGYIHVTVYKVGDRVLIGDHIGMPKSY